MSKNSILLFMNRMIISFVLGILLSVSMGVSSIKAADPFWDAVNHPFASDIETLHARGVVRGYPDGTFRPYQEVSRAEFLKMAMYFAFGREQYDDPKLCFLDFTGEEQWFWGPACTGKRRGIVEGYPNGSFEGTATVNMAEGLKMAMLAWDIPVPQYIRAPDNWYDPYFDAASAADIPSVLGNDPAHLLTRGEVAFILMRFAELRSALTGSNDIRIDPPDLREALCGNGIREGTEQCDDGNLEDGDGCSSICIAVSQPVYHAAMRIEQISIADKSVAPGAKDVTMLSFRAVAGRQDAILQRIILTDASGNVSNARNYRIMQRTTSGDLEQVASVAYTSGDNVTFSGMEILLTEGKEVTFEIKADIVENPVGSSIAMQFAVSNDTFVVASGADDSRELTGITLNNVQCDQNAYSVCWIAVYTSAPRILELATAGTLYVRKANTVAPVGILELGSETSPLLRLTLRAEKEDIEVTSINVDASAQSIESIDVYEGSSVLATLTPAGCSVSSARDFCATFSNVLTIPRSTEKTLQLIAKLKSTSQGGVSGESIVLSLTADTVDPAIRAQGLSSNAVLAQNNGDVSEDPEVLIGTNVPAANAAITGSTFTAAKIRIGQILNANPDADGESIVAGESAVGVFQFTASNSQNPSAQVSLTTLKFFVFAQNVQFDSSSWELANAEDLATRFSCTGDSTGNFTVTCSGIDTSSLGADMQAAQSISLSLIGDIQNPQVTGGSSLVQVSLIDLGNPSMPGNIVWSDGNTTFDWVDTGVTSVKSTQYRLD